MILFNRSSVYLALLILLPFANFINNKMIFISIFILALIGVKSAVVKSKKFNVYIKKLLVIISLFIFYVLLVFLNNISFVSIRDIFEISKYFIWMSILMHGFSSNLLQNIQNFKLLLFSILLLEGFIITNQVLDIDIVNQFTNLFFNLSKYFDSSRTVGTFANPNLLGFWMILIYFYIRIFNNRFKMNIFLISFLLVLLSSSRTMLLFYLLFNSIFEFNFRNLFALKSITPLIAISILIFYIVNYILSSDLFIFRYISELLNLLLSGDINLEKISSISKRLDMWAYVINYISTDDSLKLLFGFSPRKEYGFSYIDNQYIFTYFRWGIFGSILFYSIWIYIYILIDKYKKYDKGVSQLVSFLKVYLILLLFYGLVGESFSSWTLVLPFFYFLGGLISYENKVKFININN
jgi:hypothetical protein